MCYSDLENWVSGPLYISRQTWLKSAISSWDTTDANADSDINELYVPFLISGGAYYLPAGWYSQTQSVNQISIEQALGPSLYSFVYQDIFQNGKNSNGERKIKWKLL